MTAGTGGGMTTVPDPGPGRRVPGYRAPGTLGAIGGVPPCEPRGPDAPGTMKSTPGGVVDFSAEEERTMREGPDPEPARGVDDDVAHLVESLREAQRRAAGISRRVLRDFVRTRLREGRGVAEAMLVTGTLRDADIVELAPELVPLVSSEE